MKIGIIGDIHLAVTPPGRRTETYLADVQAKLDNIVEQAPGVAAWLLIGDVFHSKRANRVPPSLVLWVWDWLGRLSGGCPVYIVPGNHDLADGSIESLDRQPLAIVGRHPDVTLCRGLYSPPVQTVTGEWLSGGEGYIFPDGTSFMAVPGVAAVCDAATEPAELFTWDDTDWVFAHAPIDSVTRPWPTYDAATLPLAPRTKGVVYGHQHDRAGARPGLRTDGKHVIATGAIARGSVAEANHAPAWVELDTDDGTTVVHPIEHRPASEVFRWAERSAEAARDDTLAAFTSALGAETLVGFSREGLVADIRQRQDLPEPVRKLAADILESA